jgi:hypothetical protein
MEIAEEITRSVDGELLRSVNLELSNHAIVLVHRGRIAEARKALEELEYYADSKDLQERSSYETTAAWVLLAEGRNDEAQGRGDRALRTALEMGVRSPGAKEAFVVLIEAALVNSDDETVEHRLEIFERLRPGEVTPYAAAQAARVRSKLSAFRGLTAGVEDGFVRAAHGFREMSMPFWTAVALLELGEWLVSQGRSPDAKPLIDEASETFARLDARPWLERAESAVGRRRAASEATTG